MIINRILDFIIPQTTQVPVSLNYKRLRNRLNRAITLVFSDGGHQGMRAAREDCRCANLLLKDFGCCQAKAIIFIRLGNFSVDTRMPVEQIN